MNFLRLLKELTIKIEQIRKYILFIVKRSRSRKLITMFPFAKWCEPPQSRHDLSNLFYS